MLLLFRKFTRVCGNSVYCNRDDSTLCKHTVAILRLRTGLADIKVVGYYRTTLLLDCRGPRRYVPKCERNRITLTIKIWIVRCLPLPFNDPINSLLMKYEYVPWSVKYGPDISVIHRFACYDRTLVQIIKKWCNDFFYLIKI